MPEPRGGDDGAAGTREEPTPRTAGRQRHAEPGGRRLLAPLRWLGRKLSALARWATGRLRASLRPLARAAEHLPGPPRWLDRVKPGFVFWWLTATLALALALGLVVALLLSPVAALLALLVVAIWMLVRRRRKREDGTPAR